ncbi:hypothetical protein COV06_03355 [Candidatus Uhrbacteria bacterium CG10_big_fil_rev_8_21_14_0_10_50_16]|uniref:Uncharacterized protein n=1 Tax=Candidatus Uhrbacteria bacterium CG10_big_fil_rev_8_21_14_0_10_50_16 TaxID=1975039 RepID=A0A2H0RLU3_9BACT|nr:MAG: hypothetical protein COV06_03355 [Candidatus Uhrbacteria bacterium CG10_big_fil_rev_8_21_14_0_10_50_16]
MSQVHAIAKNTLVQLIGRVVGTAFGVFTIAILTRSLGVDGYGQFTLAMTFLAVAGALADFGFTLTTTQMISEEKANINTIVSTAFTSRLLSGLFFFALAVLIAWYMPYAPVVKLTISVGAFSYFFMTSSQMLIGVYQKGLAMWRPALAEAVSRGLILLVVAWFATAYPSAPYMMGAFAIGNVLLLIMNIAFARRFVSIRFSINFALLKQFLSRSWPIAISIFFNLLYLKGDILFLSFYRSDAEIGLYGAAYKVLDVVTVIPTMFMGLLLPMMVRAWSTKSKDKMNALIQQAFDFFALASFPMLGGAIILAEPIMRLIAGAEFSGAAPYLVILMIANTIVFFGILFAHAIVGVNKQRAILPAYIATAVVATTLYLITIPLYGAFGAAWTTVISELLIAILTTTVVIRQTSFRPRVRNVSVYLLATAVMTVALASITSILVVNHLLLLALILGGGAIYVAIVLGLGGVKMETVKLFLKKS